MNKIQMSDTIGPTATKDLGNTEIFKSTKGDFWCENTGISKEQTSTAIKSFSSQKNINCNEIEDLDLGSLLDHITGTHHQFIKEKVVIIYDLAQKVAYRHGEAHPELGKLVTTMFFFLHDLLNHLVKEEQILFSNIRQLIKNKNQSKKGTYTTFGLIKEWGRRMQKEHQSACKSFKIFDEITNNYSIPADACDSYKSLFRLMKEFEANFLMLVHLENNILFPKALVEDEEHE